MIEPKKDERVRVAWIKLELFSNDDFENSVFGDEDQLKLLFAESMDKYPLLEKIIEGAREFRNNKKNPKNN